MLRPHAITTDNPWSVYTENCDFGTVKIVNTCDLPHPRVNIDIIPPNLSNYQMNLRWVKSCYKILNEKMKSIDELHIIGFSCSKADKEEFVKNIASKIKSKKIVIYDVSKPEKLLRSLKKIHIKTEYIQVEAC